MRKIEKLFLTGCGYSVLILSLFYIFAAITEFVNPAIKPGQFVLILLFGMIISLAELLYDILKVKKVFKCLIHYAVLFVAFFMIFVISGNIISTKAAGVFIAVVVYTFFYFFIWLITNLVRRTIGIADNKLESKFRKITNEKKPQKNEYKSLYKTED